MKNNKKNLTWLTVTIGSLLSVTNLYPQPQNQLHPSPSPSLVEEVKTEVDRYFLEMMLSHHQEAIKMAKTALEKTMSAEIKLLAETIITTQTKEIEFIKPLYKRLYGTDIPDPCLSFPVQPDENHKDSDPIQAHTVMSLQLLIYLKDRMCMTMGHDGDELLKSGDFDKTFIRLMIPHHKSALTISSLIVDSEIPEIRALGKTIITEQLKEIEAMVRLNSL
jgi:uncharacterized protein (DUF305 family)